MQDIDNIIFDLGGVILNLDNQKTEQAFTDLGARDFRSFFRIGYASSFFREYETGQISSQAFIDQLRQMLQTPASEAQIIHAWNMMLQDFPAQRIILLRELRKKYRLFLFSNTNALHYIAFQDIFRKSFGPGQLDDHFDKAYYSHLMGLRKPDRPAYEHIIRENGLVPERTLFVDDAQVNVEGAEAAGLKGLHLRPGLSITDIVW